MATKKIAVKLTAYQQKLIDQLLITPKVKDAAEQIGMSYCYARRVVTKQHVIQALLESRRRVSMMAEIDAAWVLTQAVKVYDRCMQTEPVRDSDGVPTGLYTFQHTGANKALETIAKHRAVNAFQPEKELPQTPGDSKWIVEIVHVTKESYDLREKCIEHNP